MTIWDAPAEPAPGPLARRSFPEVEFVVVDVETTGWTPGNHQITEIGAVRIGAGQVRGQFSSLVNPGGPIPARISALTGISEAMVAAAPPPGEVLPGFLDFARGGVLTAHNASFDVGFLLAGCRACGLPWPDLPVLDTVELARSVLADGEVADCKLATLAAHFQARTSPRHRALADALATADVLTGLLARLTEAGVGTLAEVRAGYWDSAELMPAHRPARRSGGLPARVRAWAVRYRRWLGDGRRRRRSTWSPR